MGFPTDSGRTACENKGQAKACVNKGHDRLARGRAARGGFGLSYVYSYKLSFITFVILSRFFQSALHPRAVIGQHGGIHE